MGEKKKGIGFAKRCCATAMAVVMTTLAPLQTFAATKRTDYISELKMGFGKDAQEARNWLESEGYKVLDRDFVKDNSWLSLSGLYNEDKAVMLGYKTTKDPKQAITDIKVMGMDGNYDFDAYQELLKTQKEDIEDFLKDFNCTLNEYRENYENGLYKAIIAHDNLNMLYDNDTEQCLGDLLLEETRQEMGEDAYQALSDEEKMNHADMVTILMQANGKAVLSIEQNLYYGADPNPEESFVNRLANLGEYAAFEEEYMAGLPKSTSEKAMYTKMDRAYGDTAAMLAEKLPGFRDYMTDYTEHELFGEEDQATIDAYFASEEEEELNQVFLENAKSIYNSLQAIPYEEGTLYDFLMNDEYDLEGEDIYLLYPMASVLSPGEIAALPYVSLVQMFSGALTDEDGFKMIHDSMDETIAKKDIKASIYEGINRSFFIAESVAVTTDARNLTNSGKAGSYQVNWMGKPISNLSTVLIIMTFVTAASGMATIFVGKKITKNAVEKQLYGVSESEVVNTAVQQSTDDINTLATEAEASLIEDVSMDSYYNEAMDIGQEQFNVAYSRTATSNMSKYIGYSLCAAALIMGVVAAVKTIQELKAYYRQERTPIPQYIVDTPSGDDAANTFTYYTAVTCNRMELGYDTSDIAKERSVLANYGDLKGDVGKQWLAMYYTKNSAAGHPITTDLIIQEESTEIKPGGYKAVSMFGSSALVNFNDEKYTYGDAKGLYMMFKPDKSVDLAGSTFSSSNALILAVISAIIGFAATVVLYRKKEEGGEVA